MWNEAGVMAAIMDNVRFAVVSWGKIQRSREHWEIVWNGAWTENSF